MALKIKYGGIEIVCETADEAIAVATKLAAHKQPQAQAGTSQHASRAVPAFQGIKQPDLPAFETRVFQKSGRFDVDKVAATFLKEIWSSREVGADGDHLSQALQLSHPKGLGGRIALINSKIVSDGLKPDDVYYVKRDSSTEGKRRWYPGPALEGYLHNVA
jgi:hypothetical protein